MLDQKKRDILIIDEPFQFKYSLLLALSGLISCLLISVIVYNFVIAHDKVLLLTGLNQSPEVLAYFDVQHRILILKLVTLCVIITLFMFLLGLIISNRISGPLFAIRRKIVEILATRDLSTRFGVRRKDEFQDLNNDLNRMMQVLEERYAKDTTSIKN
jgi:signal peptidase II